MRSAVCVAFAVGAIVCQGATAARAQTTSTSTETKTFTVIAVDGNDLIVRLPEGTRDLNVPDDFRFTVNGRPLSVHELKPGMSGTAVVTTRTTVTPVTVTEIKNGTVAQVAASTIIVRTDQGFRSFTQSELDKRGIKIFKEGKPAELSELRTGDVLSATIVTSRPPKVVTQKEVDATLASSGAAPAATSSASGAASRPAGSPQATSATTGSRSGSTVASSRMAPSASSGAPAGSTGTSSSRKLPKTGGPLPLIGLAGLGLSTLGAALSVRRRRQR